MKKMNYYYNKLLNLYTRSLSDDKEDFIWINKFLIEISKNYPELISKNEYLNYLILIQNLFLTDIPDHSYHRGELTNLLKSHEYKAYMKILRQELFNTI